MVAEVSGSVLQREPEVTLYGSEPYADVAFGGGPDDAPAGVYEGTIRLSACLDPDCRTQLGNSPLTVPYRVTIQPGLHLSQDTVERNVAFGVKPTADRITVQLPAGATEWSITGFTPTDGAFSVDKALDESANFDIGFAIASPDTRSETFMVSTYAPSLAGDGRVVLFQKWFTVSYAVQEGTGAPIVFDPPNGAHYEFTAGTSEQGHEEFGIVAANGTYERVGAVYYSAPDAAADSPQGE